MPSRILSRTPNGVNNVFVFGNPDVPKDSLPLRILPALISLFPKIQFNILDPNEEWDIPKKLIIIDSVSNINDVGLFNDLESFSEVPRLTMHDFDALTNLRYLKKLGKIKSLDIIGVPADMPEQEATEKIGILLKKLAQNESA